MKIMLIESELTFIICVYTECTLTPICFECTFSTFISAWFEAIYFDGELHHHVKQCRCCIFMYDRFHKETSAMRKINKRRLVALL